MIFFGLLYKIVLVLILMLMIRLLRLIVDEDILIVLFMIGFSFLVVELVLLLNGVGLWDWLRFDLEGLLIFLLFPEDVFDGAGTEELVLSCSVYFFTGLLSLLISLNDWLIFQFDEIFFVLRTILEVDYPESYIK